MLLLGRTFTLICLTVICVLFTGCGKKQDVALQGELSGRITVSGAWALYPMMVRWSEEFRKMHPAVSIDVSAGGAGKGMADALSRNADLGMVSREINSAEVAKGAWALSVVKDAVMPTINSGNPALQTILKTGMTSNQFADVWIAGRIKDWGELSGTAAGRMPLRAYTRSDACGAAETWAKYLGGNQQDLNAVGVYGDPGLAEAVKKDKFGIGFNNINFVYDSKTHKPIDGLRIIPIDVNGNGAIDKDEDFYSSLDELVAAIADGRYPSPPARALHLVSGGAPNKKVVSEFLRWILTDGQRFVAESGYICLPADVLAKQLQLLKTRP